MTTQPSVPTGMTRRALLRSVLATSTLPLLAACGDIAASPASGPGGRQSALLLPLTGDLAALGQNMARAASLVTQSTPAGSAPPVYDTLDTAEGAAQAALQAIGNGAKILLGPMRADQTPAVLAVAGNVPVITFSNDDTLAAQGAFVMGITPAQSVATMFSYARAQGITRIAVVTRDTPLGLATASAARAIAAAGGITLTAVVTDGVSGLNGAEAVYLPDGGATLASFAKGLRGDGVQLLGSVQWGVQDVTTDPNLDGAWFAAPPPDLFLPFADQFQVAFGEQPGVVAALGHDAALLAVGLGNGRGVNRKGIVREAGFTGVLGPFRFLEDGRCQRSLAVLAVEGGSFTVLAEVSGS
jgi:branched-chain amino acid transport system substrate-binding protein